MNDDYAEVTIMRLQPDDVIVLDFPGPLPLEEAKKYREYFEEMFKGHKILMVGNGVKVSVMRPDEVPA